MAHKVINGKAVVDWTTGDPDGDRITLLKAYRDFIHNIQFEAIENNELFTLSVFKKWSIDLNNQIDEVPRIWIKRPINK
jgi:hypothetical protein